MVTYALQQVARHFGIKKTDGKPHKTRKKIVDEADIDTSANVEQYPVLYEPYRSLAYK